MVRACVFPGCSNKEVSWSPFRFHRVPLNDIDLTQRWLVALNITDVDTLTRERLRQLRVCSDHFSEEDYVKPRPNKKDRHMLKSTALPKHQPQDTCAVMDGSSGQVKSTGTEENVPEASTASAEKPILQHIVDEEAILQLMEHCPMCEGKCRCTKRTHGPYFIVYQSCYFCNYQRKWASQPEAINMTTHKANVPPKKKPKPKDKVSVNAKAQSSQLNKTSISESSESHDPSET